MSDMIVCNTAIRQDGHGRFCLNDLHRAAGGQPKHTPGRFTITQGFMDLAEEISRNQDSPSPSTSVPGLGTYVCKELVYAYAMWISPAFHLKVIRAYDAIVAHPPAIAVPQSLPEALRLAADLAEGKAKAEAQLAIVAPKAQALDVIASADGMWNVSLAAKILQIKPYKLFDWLSQNKWAYRRAGGSGSWVAYQERIQSGYLTHKVFTKSQEDGSDKGYPQLMVTGKGLARIAMLMGLQPPANDLLGKDAA